MPSENATAPRGEVCYQDRVLAGEDNSLWDDRDNVDWHINWTSQVNGVQMNSSKGLKAAVYGILLFLALPVIVSAYWLFWPSDVLVYHKADFKTKLVHAGDTIEYSIVYTKLYPITGTIHRSLVSENEKTVFVTIGPAYETLPAGKNIEYATRMIIPTEAKPGTYRIKYVINYPVNPLRVHTEEFVTCSFQVIK